MRTLTLATVALGIGLLCLPALAQNTPPGGGGGGEGAPPPGARRGPGAPFTAEQFVDRLMENDANGDGKLSRSELPERLAERLFDQANTNGDEYLDREELIAFAARFTGGGGRGGERGPAAGGTVSFEGHMRQAGRALRGLRRSALDAASRERDLDLIQRIETALVGAKSQVGTVEMAPQARSRFGEDKAAYLTEFRRHLITAITEALNVESAILAGDGTAAHAALGRLLAAQKAGHESFQPQEEPGERGERPEGGERGGRSRAGGNTNGPAPGTGAGGGNPPPKPE